jgi:hypothetical protein
MTGSNCCSVSAPAYYMTLCLEDEDSPAPIFDQQTWASLPITLSLHCDLREFRQPDPPASDRISDEH